VTSADVRLSVGQFGLVSFCRRHAAQLRERLLSLGVAIPLANDYPQPPLNNIHFSSWHVLHAQWRVLHGKKLDGDLQ
jgi:hypothetical protein